MRFAYVNRSERNRVGIDGQRTGTALPFPLWRLRSSPYWPPIDPIFSGVVLPPGPNSGPSTFHPLVRFRPPCGSLLVGEQVWPVCYIPRCKSRTCFDDLKMHSSALEAIPASEFLNFLKEIDAQVAEGLDIHIVMDNYATHKTPKIKEWLARRPHYHVHFTPTSASWINQVERWFAELTRKRLRRGVHTSVSQLEADIRSFIDRHNQNPRPFKWTKSADQILASVKRFCHARHRWQAVCCGTARATINSQCVRVTVATMSARPGFRSSDTAAGYELCCLCNDHLLFHQSPNAGPIFCSLLRRDKV
jgi:transposase